MIQELIQEYANESLKSELEREERFIKHILDTKLKFWDSIKCQFLNSYKPVRRKLSVIHSEKNGFGVRLYNTVYWMKQSNGVAEVRRHRLAAI